MKNEIKERERETEENIYKKEIETERKKDINNEINKGEMLQCLMKKDNLLFDISSLLVTFNIVKTYSLFSSSHINISRNR